LNEKLEPHPCHPAKDGGVQKPCRGVSGKKIEDQKIEKEGNNETASFPPRMAV